MLLDPFTVAAQVLNFLILVWLLRRILYGPVTRAMNEREERLRREAEAARRLREEAEAAQARHRAEVAAFEAEREARLAQARAEVETWRREQMEAAREEVEARRRRWQEALAREKTAVVRDLRDRVGHELLAVTGRALRDLADSELEERALARFVERLGALDAAERQRLLAAARDDGGRVRLRTAHPLAEDDRTRLGEAVSKALGAEVAADFETAPDLGCGAELRAGGLKVAWTLTEYLRWLEERLAAAFGDASAGGDGRG
jgi:F-type H+-transporting ATPase subunit b